MAPPSISPLWSLTRYLTDSEDLGILRGNAEHAREPYPEHRARAAREDGRRHAHDVARADGGGKRRGKRAELADIAFGVVVLPQGHLDGGRQLALDDARAERQKMCEPSSRMIMGGPQTAPSIALMMPTMSMHGPLSRHAARPNARQNRACGASGNEDPKDRTHQELVKSMREALFPNRQLRPAKRPQVVIRGIRHTKVLKQRKTDRSPEVSCRSALGARSASRVRRCCGL